MKRIYAILAMTVALMVSAANSMAQVSVGAGYGLANHTSKMITGNEVQGEVPLNMSGLYVGGYYKWNFLSKSWGSLALQPGLEYSFYSKKIEDVTEDFMGTEMTGKAYRKDHYLDVPVNVRYSYNILPGTLELSAYAGPVLSFGLACNSVTKFENENFWATMRVNGYNGKGSVKGEILGEKIDETLDEGDTGYSMFDLKLGVGIVATVIEKIDVKVGFNIGLLNRTSKMKDDSGDKFVSRTNVFQIGVGYNF